MISDWHMVGILYHYLTEKHDREYCTGISPYSGDAVPTNAWERKIMYEGVREAMSQIQPIAQRNYMTPQDIQKSIGEASKYSFEELERMVGAPKITGTLKF